MAAKRASDEVTVERLNAGDGERWRSIRLQALEEAPYAFGTTVAEASSWPAARWEQQVVDFATFVAVVGSDDENAYFAAFNWVAEATGTYRLRVTSFESINTGELNLTRD